MSFSCFHVVDQAVGVDVVVERPHLHVAGGQNQVLIVDRVHHVHHAEIARKQLVRIDAHHDLPVLAAESGGESRRPGTVTI